MCLILLKWRVTRVVRAGFFFAAWVATRIIQAQVLPTLIV
jgi:hypothetical protein